MLSFFADSMRFLYQVDGLTILCRLISDANRDSSLNRTPLPDVDRSAPVIRIVKPDTFARTNVALSVRIRATLALAVPEQLVLLTELATLFAGKLHLCT